MRTLFCSCLVFMMAVATAQAATINVVSSAVFPSGDFSVLVSGSDFPETAGATLGLRFDPNVVNVSGISLAAGSPFDVIDSSAFDNTTGEVEFITVLPPIDQTLPSGNFDAFRIFFTAVVNGPAAIDVFEDGALRGWVGADGALISGIDYNQTDVMVPLPATAGLLLGALEMLLELQRRGRSSRTRGDCNTVLQPT